MKKPVRLIVAVVCIAGILVSAGITAYMLIKADRNVLGEWLAPVRINVEIEKEYAADVSIYSPSSSWRQNFPVFTRAAQYETGKNTLLYVQLDPDDFHRNIYLRIPADAADGAINAIDNISVFIGNKLCYYPAADIQKFSKSTDGAYSLFRIPDLYYTKSLFVSNWANYYGDLNLAIKAVFNFLLYPLRFPVPYLFLFFLI
ncbi:MAG: hypothetical protein FWF22_00420 [Treponema sp.]|nr:hypothetical protein [Treponema sp.]